VNLVSKDILSLQQIWPIQKPYTHSQVNMALVWIKNKPQKHLIIFYFIVNYISDLENL
jgi:hypothetical protein